MEDDEDDDEETAPDATSKVIVAVDALTGAPCVGCARGLCGHAALLSVVLGFRDAPRCPSCFACGLGVDERAMLVDARAHIERRECFARGLAHATEREGLADGAMCIFERATTLAGASKVASESAASESVASESVVSELVASWDAGDMSCGDLVLELRTRVLAMKPGAVLRVRATEAAAPLDIPAWCGMTGHTLVGQPRPHHYDIRRKGS